eukprot:GHVS01082276.1.p1 GENE.GHVS01082276.1~~GHVS01082276.1.p1  ORF type:complete len:148 (+),score=29.58 GHVS01082276.1:107-550(+)
MASTITIKPKGTLAQTVQTGDVGGGVLSGLVKQYHDSQEITEKLSEQVNKFQREIMRLEMARKKTEADLEELAAMTDKNAKTYKQISRAFVVKPRDVLKSDLEKQQTEIDQDTIKINRIHVAMSDKLASATAQTAEAQKQLITAVKS